MTHRVDVAIGRDTVARWCAFAEQRLEYLTELYETGRWRRFHSERAFLENIQEARTAVEVWRGLATRDASRQNYAAVSWPVYAGAALPRGDILHDGIHRLSPQPVEIPVDSPPFDGSLLAEANHVFSDEAPSVTDPDRFVLNEQVFIDQAFTDQALNDHALDNAAELALDIDDIARRYPSLRNAL
jgi:uncharacterized repeat protein (TIGR03809 family)